MWPCWVSPEPADTFSSSLRFRQAALGFKFRSVGSETGNSLNTPHKHSNCDDGDGDDAAASDCLT